MTVPAMRNVVLDVNTMPPAPRGVRAALVRAAFPVWWAWWHASRALVWMAARAIGLDDRRASPTLAALSEAHLLLTIAYARTSRAPKRLEPMSDELRALRQLIGIADDFLDRYGDGVRLEVPNVSRATKGLRAAALPRRRDLH